MFFWQLLQALPLKMPVAYYSTPMSVAHGKSVKEPGLDGQIIMAKELEEIAAKSAVTEISGRSNNH